MGRNKETLLLLAIVFPYGLLLVGRYLWNMTVVFCEIAFQEKICYQWELFSRHQLTFLPLNFFGILSEKNLFSHSLRLFLAFLHHYSSETAAISLHRATQHQVLWKFFKNSHLISLFHFIIFGCTGLRCYMWASCERVGLLLAAMHRWPTAVAPLGSTGSRHVGFSSCSK